MCRRRNGMVRAYNETLSFSRRDPSTPLRFAQDDTIFCPNSIMKLSQVVEALLFSAQKPLSPRDLCTAIKTGGDDDELTPNEFASCNEAEIAATIERLKTEYIDQHRAFRLIEKAEGWQLASDPVYAPWVRQLFPATKPARLTPPALETLAIIAYRQPITRADVEAVRGVAIESVLQTLMERGLVKISGRADVPGRPLLYETTQFFLDHFGLRNLGELPNAEELKRRYLPSAPRPQESPSSDNAKMPGAPDASKAREKEQVSATPK
jgi:segregation and condensation protein B